MPCLSAQHINQRPNRHTTLPVIIIYLILVNKTTERLVQTHFIIEDFEYQPFYIIFLKPTHSYPGQTLSYSPQGTEALQAFQ